jgi:hypothetical protein
MKLRKIDENTILYVRPDGYHYHLDRQCKMLIDYQLEHDKDVQDKDLQVSLKDMKKRKLIPCPCAYE